MIYSKHFVGLFLNWHAHTVWLACDYHVIPHYSQLLLYVRAALQNCVVMTITLLLWVQGCGNETSSVLVLFCISLPCSLSHRCTPLLCIAHTLSRSLNEPPFYPAFSGREKRVTPITGLTTAVAEMARAISQQYSPGARPSSPPPISAAPSAGISPSKVANLRSNYLQQMRDLHSQYASGALTESESLDQKMPILEQLKKLA